MTDRSPNRTIEPLSDGEMLDLYRDMLLPREIVGMLDRKCWQETVIGIYLLLHGRATSNPAWIERIKAIRESGANHDHDYGLVHLRAHLRRRRSRHCRLLSLVERFPTRESSTALIKRPGPLRHNASTKSPALEAMGLCLLAVMRPKN